MRHYHITVTESPAAGSNYARTRGALVLTEEVAKAEAAIERSAGKDDQIEHRKATYESCNADCFIGRA